MLILCSLLHIRTIIVAQTSQGLQKVLMIVPVSSMSAHHESIYVGFSWGSSADIMELDLEQGRLVALRGLRWVVL